MITRQNNEKLNIFYCLLIMIVFLILATAIGYMFRMIGFNETNIVIIYLLAVLLTARFSSGYIYGILASVISIFAFNYFFTEPYFTFLVNDPSYIVTFAIMMITALLTSTLTSHVKKNAAEAHEREAETKALYMLTNHLTGATDTHDIAGIAANIISGIMDCKVAFLCFDENEMPEKTFVQQTFSGRQIVKDVEDRDDIKQKIEGLQTEYYVGEEFCDWKICGRDNMLGIVRIPKENGELMTESQKRLLRGMIESIALAMDRFRLIKQRIKYSEETIQERYRGNLLRAISHDLRTPLSGIMGTSEMLMDMTKTTDVRYNLAEEIHSDADWLHSLVENILSLTKLQDGKLMLKKQFEAVEEVVAGAANNIVKHFPEREIIIDIPEELLLVPMDAKLIEQVLINLFENAIKHTPVSAEISISVTNDDQYAVFIVADRGEGIAEEDLPKIFEMFYTSHKKRGDSQSGIGLGLVICEAIVKAHGGNIDAHNRLDGKGSEFTFTLPMEVIANE